MRTIFLILLFIFLFTNSCNNTSMVKIKGEYTCVSLNQLFKEVNRLIVSDKSLPSEIEAFFQISLLKGYVIDNDNQDIILVGQNIEQRPNYHLEDIVVNFKNVFDSLSAPYCSLDPIPKNILKLNKALNQPTDNFEQIAINAKNAIGNQQVVVGGVPTNSRHAKVMIYADYDMKKISQGLLSAAGIQSTLDISSSKENKGEKSSMSRFWLHLKKDIDWEKYPNFSENEGIVFIDKCPVVVLTEKQHVDKAGNLKDDVQNKDNGAITFAQDMSERYQDLAKERPIFAELENLFRLQACFRVMRYKNALEQVSFNASIISNLSLDAGNELPKALPGLINYKIEEDTIEHADGYVVRQSFRIVAGGVSQEMFLKQQNLTFEASLKESAKIIIDSRPTLKTLKWQIKI